MGQFPNKSTQFSSTYQPESNGRPRKYVSLLKEQGYKMSEVNDCIQVMMSMTLEELKDVWDNPKATVLEKTIASAIKKSIEKGSLYSIETLLSRVFGKPKETSDQNITLNNICANFSTAIPSAQQSENNT